MWARRCVRGVVAYRHMRRRTTPRAVVPGRAQVLVATSTLAWGVNTPAHLVIIKGTEYYDAPTKCVRSRAPSRACGWLGLGGPCCRGGGTVLAARGGWTDGQQAAIRIHAPTHVVRSHALVCPRPVPCTPPAPPPSPRRYVD